MTEHDDRDAAEVQDRVLDAADDEWVLSGVSGDPHGEDDAEALVVDNFGRHAGVGAAEHDRERCLSLGKRGPSLAVTARMPQLAADEPLVAGGEALERGVGRHRRSYGGATRSSMGLLTWSARMAHGR